ncbi:GntR family transcriptional regulator [Planobispora siamensis]|uniref:HTH gntR-type domain-containing protein n=1 Tax=Planobispora siamensis TaxID=936338 RepID=A0A8J3SC18_9ACTN|nr:winged helix-turn-helix domain-containing protein [Planobispora siamensis]GIH91901.1 hypothetical protein Psi01_25310 [Planobispora siamensis]
MIDAESELPVYQQIAAAIRERIEDGTYRRRLPTVTHLEQEYGVARNTVLQAMSHLRDLGIVYTVRNRGSFVRQVTVTTVAPESGMRIIARMPTDVERAELELADDVPVLVVEHPGGRVEVLPADATEVHIP